MFNNDKKTYCYYASKSVSLSSSTSFTTVWDKNITMENGIYVCFYSASFPANSTGYRILRFHDDKSSQDLSIINPPSTTMANIKNSRRIDITDNTYHLLFKVIQNSGKALTTSCSAFFVRISESYTTTTIS